MNYYPFELGSFACMAVSDGGLNYPVASFAREVPLSEVKSFLEEQGLPVTHVYTPYTCLYVDTGNHKVLIDTGVGESLGLGVKNMFPDVDNTETVAGTLAQNLQSAGIKPPDIDTVIITHAHPDHIGGNLDMEGEIVYPNAQYYIWKGEWDFWSSDEKTAGMPPHFVDIAHKYMEPVLDRLTFIEKEGELLPGISIIETAGHTPGHISVSITSEGERLLHFADAVIHPIHLMQPDWVPAFDVLPEESLASKRKICDLAASEEVLVFAHHFPPFPNLGYVSKEAKGWQWKPLEIGQAVDTGTTG